MAYGKTRIFSGHFIFALLVVKVKAAKLKNRQNITEHKSNRLVDILFQNAYRKNARLISRGY